MIHYERLMIHYEHFMIHYEHLKSGQEGLPRQKKKVLRDAGTQRPEKGVKFQKKKSPEKDRIWPEPAEKSTTRRDI